MLRKGMFSLYLVTLLFVSQFVVAQEVVYKVTATTLDGPEQLDAGFHTFTMQSDGVKGYSAMLFRLKEGATLEEFIPLNEAVDKAFNGEGDPAAALNEELERAEVIFENNTIPGQSQASVGVVLEEGTYVFSYNEDVEEGPSSYRYKTLEVTANASPTVAPEAHQTIQFVDFAFTFPPDLKTGEQTWHIVNQGTQLHHAVIFKLKEGKTLEDVMAFMETEEGEQPYEDEGEGSTDIGILSPERESYMTVNLTSGNYAAFCYVPDTAVGGDGAPHFAHGMMQAFTISE
jgi:hypothetical protein